MKIQDIANGTTIAFTDKKLKDGNPVIGELISQSNGWFVLKLNKDIKGATIRYKGETTTFRKPFCSDFNII